jgi:NADPH:quinone reductase-like Zn-dependent oxidoreductase
MIKTSRERISAMANGTTAAETQRQREEQAATPMAAIVQRAYGSADTLRPAQIDRPEPGADQVLIEVHAAGVDRGVWHLMTGMPYLVRLMGYGLRRPKNPVPGLDVAGRVVAVGDNVARFQVGDEVFGIAGGSYAEYAIAEESKLAHKPANVTFEQAGVAAISGITALQALSEVADVAAGQDVLVIGASGGVGTYAVQIAKALGGRVTGVASGAKAEFVRSLGADDVVDYRHTDYLDGSVRYDVIIDIGGRNPVRKLRRALHREGTLVIVGGEGGGRWTGGIGRQLRALMVSPFVSQRLAMFISEEHHRFMDRLARHLELGEVTPAIGERFALADTADAIRMLEAGATRGKSVIIVRGEADGT